MPSHSTGAMRARSAAQSLPQQKKPQLKVVKTQRSLSVTLQSFRTLCAIGFVILTMVLMLYHQVQLTEVTGEINSLTSELDELQGENARLRSELEATMSLSVIGERAEEELGMSRRDKYQTIYINMETEDHAQIAGEEDGVSLSKRIVSGVKGAIASIQEYLVGQKNID